MASQPTNMIKLIRNDIYERVVAKAIYCNPEERRQIIEKWRNNYDKLFENCFLQIAPHVDGNVARKLYGISVHKKYYK